MIYLGKKSFFFVLFAIAVLSMLVPFIYNCAAVSPAVAAAKGDFTVIIDAGHGGYDGGAVPRDGVVEKTLNLAIAKRLETALLKAGFTVIMTRKDDGSLASTKKEDMRARLDIMRLYPEAAFISVHCNKFIDPKYYGMQTFYSATGRSEELAKAIQARFISDIDPSCTREAKKAPDSIYLMKKAEGTAIIVECGFLSNSKEAKLLGTPEYQQKLAEMIASAIIDFYNKDE